VKFPKLKELLKIDENRKDLEKHVYDLLIVKIKGEFK
jgi:hypothetical protein